jgi:hypothetical protein
MKNLITMPDNGHSLGDAQPDEGGEDIVFLRVNSLDIFKTFQHPEIFF